MTDIDFKVSGIIFASFDPLNLILKNIDIDYSRNIGGFNINPVCNYPEAYLEGMTSVTNITFYYAGGSRLVDSLYFHFFLFTGPGPYLINGLSSAVYTTYSESRNILYYQMQANWLPMIDTIHYINYSNTFVSLPFDNSLNDKYALAAWQVYSDTYRHHTITFSKFLI